MKAKPNFTRASQELLEKFIEKVSEVFPFHFLYGNFRVFEDRKRVNLVFQDLGVFDLPVLERMAKEYFFYYDVEMSVKGGGNKLRVIFNIKRRENA